MGSAGSQTKAEHDAADPMIEQRSAPRDEAVASTSDHPVAGGAAGDRTRISNRNILLTALLVTSAAAGLRLWRLEVPSFNDDHLRQVAYAVTEPTFYTRMLSAAPERLAMWLRDVDFKTFPVDEPELWRALGITELNARMPSCIIGILTVGVLYLLTVKIATPRVAALAAVFLTFSHWHVFWSQSSRFYALTFLFYNVALLLYFHATSRGGRLSLVGAMLAMTGLGMTQPVNLVIVGVFALDWIVLRLRRRPLVLGVGRWAILLTAAGVVGLMFLHDMTLSPERWTRFGERHAHSPVRMLMGAAFYIQPAVLVAGALSGLWLLQRGQRIGTYLLIAGALPILVLSGMATGLYVESRYMFVALYPWLLLGAFGCVRIWDLVRSQTGRLLAATPVLLLLAAQAVAMFEYYTVAYGFRQRRREACRFVANRIGPEDQVFGNSISDAYYLQRPVQMSPRDVDAESLTKPAWIILIADDPDDARFLEPFKDRAQLMASFPSGTTGQRDLLQVFYYP